MNLLASVLLIVVNDLIAGTHSTGCNTIRLVGGLSDQGLVEICDGDQWKSVCDFLWTDMKAEIACRELNLTYSGAQAYSGGGCSAFNMSTSDEGIFIQVCTGDERSITECDSAEKTNCIAAGVICSPLCDPSYCNGSNSQCLPPTSTCSCPTPSNTNCICTETVCSPACLNDGTCTAPGECQCPPGWTGHTCQQAICDPPCSNGGKCAEPDTCQCPDTWEGDACQQAPMVIVNTEKSTSSTGSRSESTTDGSSTDSRGESTTDESSIERTMDNGTESTTDGILVVVVLLIAVVIAGTVLLVLSALWRRSRRRKTVGTSTHLTRNDDSNEAQPLSNSITDMTALKMEAPVYDYIMEPDQSEDPTIRQAANTSLSSSHVQGQGHVFEELGTQQYAKLNQKNTGLNSTDQEKEPEVVYDQPNVDERRIMPPVAEYEEIQDFITTKKNQEQPLNEYDIPHELDRSK